MNPSHRSRLFAMSGTPHSIHTRPHSPTQGLVNLVASNQVTVIRLLRQAMAGNERADTIHGIRTHCRRLQALLELCGEAGRARAVAEGVTRLSTLRALQVFWQYLMTCDAGHKDLALVDHRLTTKKLNLTET